MTELMVFGSRRLGIALRILIIWAPFVENRNGNVYNSVTEEGITFTTLRLNFMLASFCQNIHITHA